MELVPWGANTYEAKITMLKVGGRRDIEVAPVDPEAPKAFGETDIVGRMRLFFLAIDAEAKAHRGDPVALSQALARLEALVADLRAVKDDVKRMAAEALNDQRIRRLTVQGVVTLEGTSQLKRSGWRNEELLGDLLNGAGFSLLETSTGLLVDGIEAADMLLEWFRPEWKMTAIKKSGLDPNQYCEVETDEDGKPVSTPTVRMVDNRER